MEEQFKNYVEQFDNEQSITNELVKNGRDILVSYLALVYDFNFDYSFKHLIENNIIDKIKNNINEPRLNCYFDKISKYIEKRNYNVR